MNIKEILNTALEYRKQDQKIDKAFEGFIKTISPDYSPFIEITRLSGYLKGIEQFNRGLSDDLSRYIYEIDWKKKNTREIVTEGKEYKINTKQDFIKYLEDIYNSNQ